MVRKIIQWVPIDGTRWRNEFVNRHENDGVDIHYGVAHRGVMPTQRAIGSGPRKGICSHYGSLTRRTLAPTTHLFVGEDACDCQKLASQKSAEIRSHQDALQTIPASLTSVD